MKTKKKIRLTESDLENLINESVRSVLNEGINKKRLSEFEQELQQLATNLKRKSMYYYKVGDIHNEPMFDELSSKIYDLTSYLEEFIRNIRDESETPYIPSNGRPL